MIVKSVTDIEVRIQRHVFYARYHPIKFAVISNSVIELYFYLSQTSLDLKVYFENVENGKNISKL
jgi:hypothetical protein